MAKRKLSRDSGQRKALFRSLTTEIILNERIVTTEAKAKELRPYIERMVTLGKRGDLHARRQAAAFVYTKQADEESNETAVQKLFGEIAERYEDRQGGYTRIRKIGPRRGDNASVVMIEFVE